MKCFSVLHSDKKKRLNHQEEFLPMSSGRALEVQQLECPSWFVNSLREITGKVRTMPGGKEISDITQNGFVRFWWNHSIDILEIERKQIYF